MSLLEPESSDSDGGTRQLRLGNTGGTSARSSILVKAVLPVGTEVKSDVPGDDVDANDGERPAQPDKSAHTAGAAGAKGIAARYQCHADALQPPDEEAPLALHAEAPGDRSLANFRGLEDCQRWSDGALALAGGALLPDTIAAYLRPYQRDGVRWLYERLFVENRGCLLTDEMGLGKTVQVACCLAAGMYGKPMSPDQRGSSLVGPVLVLCPPSLLDNWGRELRRWGPFGVEVLPVGGASALRQRALRRVEACISDVLVASRGLLSRDYDELGPGDHAEAIFSRSWGCIVVDEVHQAKNPKGCLHRSLIGMRSDRKLGLTGTPLQNQLSDVWALLRIVGAHEGWELSSFESHFGRPIARGQKRKASVKDLSVREDALKEFHELLHRSCLRRTKNGVALMLPGKNDRIVPCPLSDVQRAAYQNLLASPDFQLALGKRQLCVCGAGRPCFCGAGPIWRHVHRRQAEQKGLEDEWAAADDCMCRGRVPPKCLSFSLITVLQRLTNHIEQLKPEPSAPKDSAEEAQQTMMRQLCDIAFAGIDHNLCTQRRVANRLQLGSPEACGKMQMLLPLLRAWRRKGEKVLIFSRSTRLLDILEACLFQQGCSPQTLRLDGATPPGQRQRLVDDFNTSSTRGIFLISTRAGGVGLNLTSASVVVIFDPDWNPCADLQAQDRSFRIGQTRVVEVYRLLGAGTIEEQVYMRQVWKQQLAASAIDGTRSARRLDDKNAFGGLAQLLELHNSSVLPRLMGEACIGKKLAVSEEAGVGVFEDLRNGEPEDSRIGDLLDGDVDDGQPKRKRTAKRAIKAEEEEGEDHLAEGPAPAWHDEGASQALELLHGMFDQVDHSKLMRNDTQENILLNDLDLHDPES